MVERTGRGPDRGEQVLGGLASRRVPLRRGQVAAELADVDRDGTRVGKVAGEEEESADARGTGVAPDRGDGARKREAAGGEAPFGGVRDVDVG